jgi:4-hydroxythreonine-4-phosphate dehydrogenase
MTFSQKIEGTPPLPRIGITMGDAAGIGPEIILKAVLDRKIGEWCLPIIIGDAFFLCQTAEKFEN